MGFSAEELVEVTFAVGQMAGLDLLYVHLIAEGVNMGPTSRARARSRTRSTRTSSRRPSFERPSCACHLPQVNMTVVAKLPRLALRIVKGDWRVHLDE